MKVLALSATQIWNKYKDYAETVVGYSPANALKDVNFWRKKLLSIFTIYFIPVSFIALVPGVWMSIVGHLWTVAVLDVMCVVFVTVTLLNKRLSQWVKNTCVLATLYFLAVILIINLGLFGPGALYLYGITVFMAVMFNANYAYWSVGAHVLTCGCMAVCIDLKIFHFGAPYTSGAWIAFSSNLIFLCLVTVMLISALINGLELTVQHTSDLNAILENQNIQNNELNDRLKENVSQYKGLFFDNPLAIWVLDPVTLSFLEVNNAATRVYGYSHDEFLSLKIYDIKHENEVANVADIANKILTSHKVFNVVTRHYKKDGQLFPVKLQYNVIMYKGAKALLGIADDISEQAEYVHAIEVQNKKLTEIAFIQSHLVRAPLARILGLTYLLYNARKENGLGEELVYLRESADELDMILRDIIKNTDQLSVIKPINNFE